MMRFLKLPSTVLTIWGLGEKPLPYIKKDDFDISLWEETINAEYNEREKARIDTLKTIICILKDYFKDKCVKRVLIVGSILKEGRFCPFSDVDIAVEGLREKYFRTLVYYRLG